MSNIDIIRIALETRLGTLSGLPDVAYQNTKYEPTRGTPYIRPTLMVGTGGLPVNVGQDSSLLWTGIYQIDIFRPKGEGTGDGYDLATNIQTHFKNATILTESGQQVRIRHSQVRTGKEDGDWYKIPVDVTWYAFVP